jgi:hypothetical protein
MVVPGEGVQKATEPLSKPPSASNSVAVEGAGGKDTKRPNPNKTANNIAKRNFRPLCLAAIGGIESPSLTIPATNCLHYSTYNLTSFSKITTRILSERQTKADSSQLDADLSYEPENEFSGVCQKACPAS